MNRDSELSPGGVPLARNSPDAEKLLTVHDLVAELSQWNGGDQVVFRSTSDGSALRFYCFRSPEAGILEINLND
jgi:hypothetical protein